MTGGYGTLTGGHRRPRRVNLYDLPSTPAVIDSDASVPVTGAVSDLCQALNSRVRVPVHRLRTRRLVETRGRRRGPPPPPPRVSSRLQNVSRRQTPSTAPSVSATPNARPPLPMLHTLPHHGSSRQMSGYVGPGLTAAGPKLEALAVWSPTFYSGPPAALHSGPPAALHSGPTAALYSGPTAALHSGKPAALYSGPTATIPSIPTPDGHTSSSPQRSDLLRSSGSPSSPCGACISLSILMLVVGVIGLVAVAAYLGVLTNSREALHDRLRFIGRFQVTSGDYFHPDLLDRSSLDFNRRTESYSKMLVELFGDSLLSAAIEQLTVVQFIERPVLTVVFSIRLDSRRLTRDVLNPEEAIRDVITQDILSVEPQVFRTVHIDIGSIRIQRVVDHSLTGLFIQPPRDNSFEVAVKDFSLTSSSPSTVELPSSEDFTGGDSVSSGASLRHDFLGENEDIASPDLDLWPHVAASSGNRQSVWQMEETLQDRPADQQISATQQDPDPSWRDGKEPQGPLAGYLDGLVATRGSLDGVREVNAIIGSSYLLNKEVAATSATEPQRYADLIRSGSIVYPSTVAPPVTFKFSARPTVLYDDAPWKPVLPAYAPGVYQYVPTFPQPPPHHLRLPNNRLISRVGVAEELDHDKNLDHDSNVLPRPGFVEEMVTTSSSPTADSSDLLADTAVANTAVMSSTSTTVNSGSASDYNDEIISDIVSTTYLLTSKTTDFSTTTTATTTAVVFAADHTRNPTELSTSEVPDRSLIVESMGALSRGDAPSRWTRPPPVIGGEGSATAVEGILRPDIVVGTEFESGIFQQQQRTSDNVDILSSAGNGRPIIHTEVDKQILTITLPNSVVPPSPTTEYKAVEFEEKFPVTRYPIVVRETPIPRSTLVPPPLGPVGIRYGGDALLIQPSPSTSTVTVSMATTRETFDTEAGGPLNSVVSYSGIKRRLRPKPPSEIVSHGGASTTATSTSADTFDDEGASDDYVYYDTEFFAKDSNLANIFNLISTRKPLVLKSDLTQKSVTNGFPGPVSSAIGSDQLVRRFSVSGVDSLGRGRGFQNSDLSSAAPIRVKRDNAHITPDRRDFVKRSNTNIATGGRRLSTIQSPFSHSSLLTTQSGSHQTSPSLVTFKSVWDHVVRRPVRAPSLAYMLSSSGFHRRRGGVGVRSSSRVSRLLHPPRRFGTKLSERLFRRIPGWLATLSRFDVTVGGAALQTEYSAIRPNMGTSIDRNQSLSSATAGKSEAVVNKHANRPFSSWQGFQRNKDKQGLESAVSQVGHAYDLRVDQSHSSSLSSLAPEGTTNVPGPVAVDGSKRVFSAHSPPVTSGKHGSRPPLSNFIGSWSSTGSSNGPAAEDLNRLESGGATNASKPQMRVIRFRQDASVQEILDMIFQRFSETGVSGNEVNVDGEVAPVTTADPPTSSSTLTSASEHHSITVSSVAVEENAIADSSSFLQPAIPTSLASMLKNFSVSDCSVDKTCSSASTTEPGVCGSARARCDMISDCADGSDESSCTCADHLRAQRLHHKICDGLVDCPDYSDEQVCDWCSAGQFVCPGVQRCVNTSAICDGRSDCPDGADERHCLLLSPSRRPPVPDVPDQGYTASGYLMVRRSGVWAPLCADQFDSDVTDDVISPRPSANQLGDHVCRSLTYSSAKRVFRVRSSTSQTSHKSSDFFRLMSLPEHYSSDQSLVYRADSCALGNTLHVTCSSLLCGQRPRTRRRLSRVVGGSNTGPGDWPWNVAMYREGEYQCGATLISHNWLISAAHCFVRSQERRWVARLGGFRRGSVFLSPHEQLRTVARISIHPHYEDAGYLNDIALLKLRKNVVMSDYVRPICLPSADHLVHDGHVCTVIGWGQLFETGHIFPDTLQEVQLPLISTGECQRRTRHLPLYRVTGDMFCAGLQLGGKDACLGDSGGPLMCLSASGAWKLTGITSNGYGCARARRPGVYTKVANYLSWIEAVMRQTDVPPQRTQCSGLRCPLGRCLPSELICDGVVHCSDGSDEISCYTKS